MNYPQWDTIGELGIPVIIGALWLVAAFTHREYDRELNVNIPCASIAGFVASLKCLILLPKLYIEAYVVLGSIAFLSGFCFVYASSLTFMKLHRVTRICIGLLCCFTILTLVWDNYTRCTINNWP